MKETLCLLGLLLPTFLSASQFRLPEKTVRSIGTIDSVIVYSDRARIIKEGKVKNLSAGEWIHIQGLPLNLDRGSLKVNIKRPNNIDIDQVVFVETFERKPLDKDLSSLRDDFEKLFGKKLDILQKLKLIEDRLSLVKNLQFSSPTNNTHEKFLAFNTTDKILDGALNTISRNIQQLVDEREDLIEKLNRIDEDLSVMQANLSGLQDLSEDKWVLDVYVLPSIKMSADISYSVDYILPNAKWYPIYDLRATLDYKRGVAKVKLITSGQVEQKTGEDWDQVDVVMSSMDPLPLILPELSQWRLKETREDVYAEKDRLMAPSLSLQDEKADMAPSRQGMERKKSFAAKAKREMPASPAQTAKVMMRANEAAVAMEEQREESDFAMMAGNGPRSIIPHKKNPSELFPLTPIENLFPEYANTLQNLDQYASNEKNIRLAEFPAARGSIKKSNYHDPLLPAVSSNGRLVEYKSPYKLSLKSHAPMASLPLQSSELEGELEYFSIPKKDNRVFMMANVINQTDLPILKGQGQVFMNGELVMKTQLETVPERGLLKINLGIDSDVDIKRSFEKNALKEGMVFKKHSTVVKVKIQLANHHDFPISIVVKDSYPLSPNEEIKVELLEVSPKPIEEINGVVSWKENVKRKSKKDFLLTYKVTHPENYIMSEFN